MQGKTQKELLAALQRSGLAGPGEEPAVEQLSGGISAEILRVELADIVICAKRPRGRMQVKADWLAPVERGGIEVDWLRRAATVIPGHVPRVLGMDQASGWFFLEYLDPGRFDNWKQLLRDGVADPGLAARVAQLAVTVSAHSSSDPRAALDFDNGDSFHAQRIDPYLLESARRNPDVADHLEKLAHDTASTRLALLHGDLSPKNILVDSRPPAGSEAVALPVLLDAETACWGDPAFDLAFCLNHLALKCAWQPQHSKGYLACWDAFVDSYLAGVSWEDPELTNARAAALLPALMLARIDGKSPVEYLVGHPRADEIRKRALLWLARPASKLTELRHDWQRQCLAWPAARP
jgi:aminoglycoside phosphotransferase (APT) family kinase protein